MPVVEIYTKTFCPYCWRAKELLASKGLDYQEVAVDFGGEARQLMVQRFGLRFSTVHVWRLLGQLGFSPQRTVGRARERDEAKIAEWKTKQWPRLKKKPGGSAAPSSSSTRAD